MNFYLLIKGESVGPLREAELQSRLEAGTVTGETLASQEGVEGWQPISQLFDVEWIAAPEAKPIQPPPLPRPRQVQPVGLQPESASHTEKVSILSQRRALAVMAVAIVALLLTVVLGARGKQPAVDPRNAFAEIDALKELVGKLSQDVHQVQREIGLLTKTLSKMPPPGDGVANDTSPTAPVADLPPPQTAPSPVDVATGTQSAGATPPADDAPRRNLVGPRILGIQLGDDVESVCQRFNAEFASNLDGKSMSVRKLASDGTFVCSTPDGLNAAIRMDEANDSAGGDGVEGLIGALLGGGMGVLEARLAQAPIIYADQHGVISKYVIGNMAINQFFERAAFVSNQEFASFLSVKYQLPDLEAEMVEINVPFSNSSDYVPKYHGFSTSGYSVRIDEHKAIFIEGL